MSVRSKFKKLMNLHPEAASEFTKLVDSYTSKTLGVVPNDIMSDVKNVLAEDGIDVVRATHEYLEDLFVTAFVMGQTTALDKLRKVEDEIEEEDDKLLETDGDEVDA